MKRLGGELKGPNPLSPAPCAVCGRPKWVHLAEPTVGNPEGRAKLDHFYIPAGMPLPPAEYIGGSN